jgi:hypothetical protein
MAIYTNKQGRLEIKFTEELIKEGSWGHRKLGKHESTVTLYQKENGVPTMIEWDVPSLGVTETIGLWFDGKNLMDYDGIMGSIPKEGIKLINKAGYTVPQEFRD